VRGDGRGAEGGVGVLQEDGEGEEGHKRLRKSVNAGCVGAKDSMRFLFAFGRKGCYALGERR
jgi:hypothetical protein